MINNVWFWLFTGFSILTITIFLVNIIRSINLKYIQSQKIYSGFLLFNIDLINRRVRINNDIDVLRFLPNYLKNLKIVNGMWFSMELFISIFSSDTQKLLIDAFNPNTSKTSEFKLNISMDSFGIREKKYNLILERYDLNYFYGTLSWNEIEDYEPFVAEYQTSNFVINNDAEKCLFLKLNSEHSFEKKEIIKNLKNIIPKVLFQKVFLWTKGDNLYIFYNENEGIENINSIFFNLLQALRKFNKYFDLVVLFSNDVLQDVNEFNFNILCNFCRYKNSLKSENQFNYIEINKQFLDQQEYKFFLKKYNDAIATVNNGEYVLNKQTTMSFDEDIKNTILSLNFSDAWKKKYYRENFSRTDIYEYLFLHFLQNFKKFNFNDSLLLIEDYTFNYLNINYLKKIQDWENNEEISYIVNITNNLNLENLWRKINSLSDNSYRIGIKINKIDENVFFFLTKTNIKYLVISSSISSDLNNEKNVLYISALLNFQKSRQTKIIFENFNKEYYNKFLYKLKS
ncbi:hypothetical protein PT304_00355 [Metamycoplasma hyosynoviae]|uniref:MHO_4530 family protein n=1 Tax=Metamycoplasma hyosynoviae TaxID=29559 RepID=UPI00235F30FA|nr:hypothetical protein [Metamycoplasma hyosynoviae]MDD1365944.1 hypothetical protein [Metamycoplasma hyosynoviae]